MPVKIASRHRWALELLDVRPDDRLLEIGCGTGIVASIVAESLEGGRIVAIDRSDAMIRMAAKRGARHIQSGKASFECGELIEFDWHEASFDKVYAINVSLFWNGPVAELEILRRVLTPDGALYIVHHPPARGKATESAEIMTDMLPRHGFEVSTVVYQELDNIPAVCVVSRVGALEQK